MSDDEDGDGPVLAVCPVCGRAETNPDVYPTDGSAREQVEAKYHREGEREALHRYLYEFYCSRDWSYFDAEGHHVGLGPEVEDWRNPVDADTG